MTVITAEQLQRQHELRGKLFAIGTGNRERDQVIRDAHKAGISSTEIARLLGLSRQHVSLIANGQPS